MFEVNKCSTQPWWLRVYRQPGC